MIKTRFAPSPTGYIHIGNVRSAIYPYLIAKQSGGKFILRIEDTDQKRYTEGATELIVKTLKWLGLDWDEGVEVGGPNAPYYQSERREIYLKYAEKLIASGHAYLDPTPPEQIDTYRKADNAAKVPYLYRNHRPAAAELSPEENLELWHKMLLTNSRKYDIMKREEGEESATNPGFFPLRFKTTPENHSWHDEVMGDLKTGPEVCDDIILIKKDGLPTYNFAHIVDDYEMQVTHVVRGVEYLSSMPNYLSLYNALEITPPKFVSLPHVLAPQGNKKLSKRDGAKSVIDYKEAGILPEAMLNYLACLGWNDGTEQEIYSKSDLIEKFNISRIQNSGARFDETKLLWQNGIWIRKIFDENGVDALYSRTKGYWPATALAYPEEYRKKVLGIIYDRLKTLDDLKTMTDYFFAPPRIDLPALVANKFLKQFSEKELADLLQTAVSRLQEIPESEWNAEKIQTVLNNLLVETDKKPAEFFSLIRISTSFAPFSPALHLTAHVLGREIFLSRLNSVRSALLNDL